MHERLIDGRQRADDGCRQGHRVHGHGRVLVPSVWNTAGRHDSMMTNRRRSGSGQPATDRNARSTSCSLHRTVERIGHPLDTELPGMPPLHRVVESSGTRSAMGISPARVEGGSSCARGSGDRRVRIPEGLSLQQAGDVEPRRPAPVKQHQRQRDLDDRQRSPWHECDVCACRCGSPRRASIGCVRAIAHAGAAENGTQLDGCASDTAKPRIAGEGFTLDGQRGARPETRATRSTSTRTPRGRRRSECAGAAGERERPDLRSADWRTSRADEAPSATRIAACRTIGCGRCSRFARFATPISSTSAGQHRRAASTATGTKLPR